jgi:hypothetical protein
MSEKWLNFLVEYINLDMVSNCRNIYKRKKKKKEKKKGIFLFFHFLHAATIEHIGMGISGRE